MREFFDRREGSERYSTVQGSFASTELRLAEELSRNDASATALYTQ